MTRAYGRNTCSRASTLSRGNVVPAASHHTTRRLADNLFGGVDVSDHSAATEAQADG